MDIHALSEEVKRNALELGFDRCAITTADPIEPYEDELLHRSGYELFSPQDPDSPLRTAAHPALKLPQAKSIISLVRGVSGIDFPKRLLQHLGRIYLGRCYVPPDGTIAGKRIALFEEHLAALGITSLYDHSNMQLVDRAIAARAGLISYGKNNFAYAGELGSFIVLVSIPVDVALECEVYQPQRPCPDGCRACIDVCPTQAMDDSGALDASRCVLYSNFMPGELKDISVTDLIGMRIHGCDACQEACPRNRKALEAPKVKDPFLEWLDTAFDLEKLLFCDDSYYEACVKPVMFNYIEDIDIFRQNAAIAMGNSGEGRYLEALHKAAEVGSEQVARFAAHAIERIEAASAHGA